jgi:hypothetical protein
VLGVRFTFTPALHFPFLQMLQETVAMTRVIEAQIDEIQRRGWNIV